MRLSCQVKIALPARPEPIEIDREQTAVLLVDMQNAFASTGGMLDLAGIDVKPAAAAVANARRVVDAARAASVPVIYLVMGYPPDQSPVITKSRYSGFAGTPLDALLRGRGIRTLLMAGIASNVCVESTLRDAYFHEYWPVMIEDATMPAGSPEIQRATVYNVTTFFGWVSTAAEVAGALHAK